MHFLCHLDKYTFVPNQKMAAQKRMRQIVWLDNSTGKLGHNLPKKNENKTRPTVRIVFKNYKTKKIRYLERCKVILPEHGMI